MVAGQAVDAPAGIDDQALFAGLPGEAKVHVPVGGKRFPGVRVRHQLDPQQQPPAPDVPDDGMARRQLFQTGFQERPHPLGVAAQVVIPDDVHHLQPHGAGHGIAGVGVAVLESAALHHRVGDLPPGDDGPQGIIPRPHSFGQRHHVRLGVPVLVGEEFAGPAEGGHHLVEDEEDAVFLADPLDDHEIFIGRNHRAGGGAADGFGHEGGHVFGSLIQDGRFQVPGAPDAAFRILRAVMAPVAVGRRNFGIGSGQGAEGIFQGRVGGQGQGPQGGPVVGGRSADKDVARPFAFGPEILPADLHGRFHRLGPARDVEDPVQVRRRGVHQGAGQFQGGPALELGPVGEHHARRRLVRHGLGQPRMPVPQMADHGPGAAVNVFFPVLVPDVDALGLFDQGQSGRRLIKKVGPCPVQFRLCGVLRHYGIAP